MIDPAGKDLKRYLTEDPGGPVVMFNLLRFEPDGGRERYADYLAHFREHSARFGAEVLYVGTGSTTLVAEPGQAWDAVLVVRYPDRRSFSQMVADPAYPVDVPDVHVTVHDDEEGVPRVAFVMNPTAKPVVATVGLGRTRVLVDMLPRPRAVNRIEPHAGTGAFVVEVPARTVRMFSIET